MIGLKITIETKEGLRLAKKTSHKQRKDENYNNPKKGKKQRRTVHRLSKAVSEYYNKKEDKK